MQTLVLGGVGKGKTTQARKVLLASRRRFILDPRAEHHHARYGGADLVCHSLRDLKDAFDTDTTLFDHTVLYTGLNEGPDATPAIFEFMTHLRGWGVLVDECDEFCNPHGWSTDWFRKLTNFRRHYKIDLVLIARRAADVHGAVISGSDELLIFGMHSDADLKRVAAECGQEWADAARDLPQRQFIRKVFEHHPEIHSRTPQ